MPTTEATPFLSPPLPGAVETRADTVAPISGDLEARISERDRWDRIIDQQLIEWGRDPTRFDDEGVEPPAGETIQRAVALAQGWRDDGLAAPDNVCVDPSGGIVFERREGSLAEIFHLWDDGTVEYLSFEGTRLINRWKL